MIPIAVILASFIGIILRAMLRSKNDTASSIAEKFFLILFIIGGVVVFLILIGVFEQVDGTFVLKR